MNVIPSARGASRTPRLTPVALVSALAIVGAAAAPGYAGTAGAYVLFQAACILLAGSLFLRPTSYGFTTLSIFLLLGFWVKAVAMLVGVPVLIEPTGNFDGSPASSDRAILFAAAGLTGLAMSRFLLHFAAAGVVLGPRDTVVPGWYVHRRRAIWSVTCLALTAGAYANLRFRFYMVGVHELLILPFPFNAALAWWYTVGAGLWIATLLEWERRMTGGKSFALWLLVPFAEALLTSVVTLSRGAYLMKMLPYVLVLLRGFGQQQGHVRRRSMVPLLGIAALGFGVSLAGVSWLRILTYPSIVGIPSGVTAGRPLEPSAGEVRSPRHGGEINGAKNRERQTMSATTSAAVEARVRELGRMVLGRWIGLEGVLAIAAAPDRGADLLIAGIVENPRAGNAALFQKLSRATYKPLDGFTFLTVPGVIAVLAYSGSYIVILLGMCLAGSLLLGFELATRRLFQNDFLCAVAGVAAANALAQMNFPYLTLVFFVELTVTLTTLWLIQRHWRSGSVGTARPSRLGREGAVLR